MAKSDQIRVEYIAEIKDLKKRLAEIPDVTAAEARKMVREIQRASREGAGKAADAHKDAAKKSARHWDDAAASVKSSLVGAGGVLAAVGAAAIGVAALAQKQADMVNQLTDASVRSGGIAAETLAGLKLAAEGAGLGFADMEKITDKLPRLLADVEAGSKRQIEAFEKLGVETHEATGEMRSADVLFRDLVRSLGDIEDPMERATRAADLFGRSSGKLLQALGDPSALDAFVAAAQRGVDVSQAGAEAANRWQREMAGLKVATQGAADSISTALGASGLSGVVRGLGQDVAFVSTIISENISARAREFQSLAERLGSIDWSSPLQAMKSIAMSGVDLVQGVTGWSDVGDTLAKATEAAHLYGMEQNKIIKATADAAKTPQLPELPEVSARSPTSAGSDKQALKLAKEREAAARDREAAVKRLADIQRAASLAVMDDEQKIIYLRDEQLEQLRDLAMATGDRESAVQSMLDVELAADEKLSAISDKRGEEARQRAREEIALAHEVSQSRLSMAATLADSLGSISQSIASQDAKAQLRAFRVSKAAAAVTAGINTAAAISEANKAAPPPYNIPLIIQAAAVGVAQEVAILSTQPPVTAYGGYDIPTTAPPSGVPIIGHPGERVQTRSEAERSSGPRESYTRIQIGGRDVARTVTEDTRIGGPMAAELRRSFGRVGRMQRST